MTTDGQTDHFTPCTCVWGDKNFTNDMTVSGKIRENFPLYGSITNIWTCLNSEGAKGIRAK